MEACGRLQSAQLSFFSSSFHPGPAYYDFIASRGLPTQMAEVDPIVASHAGGAVGIMTAQLLGGNKRRQ